MRLLMQAAELASILSQASCKAVIDKAHALLEAKTTPAT